MYIYVYICIHTHVYIYTHIHVYLLYTHTYTIDINICISHTYTFDIDICILRKKTSHTLALSQYSEVDALFFSHPFPCSRVRPNYTFLGDLHLYIRWLCLSVSLCINRNGEFGPKVPYWRNGCVCVSPTGERVCVHTGQCVCVCVCACVRACDAQKYLRTCESCDFIPSGPSRHSSVTQPSTTYRMCSLTT